MVLSYGRGRVFHTTMGHDVSALSSVDFVATFQRGSEWAATGSVTQKVPPDFPTADSVSYRADLAAMDRAQTPAGGRGAQASPRRGAAAGDGDTAVVSAGAGARRPAGLCRAVRLLPRARRDGRRNRSRPHARASVAADVRGDKLGPIVRGGRVGQGHAGVQPRRRRPGGDRRFHPRPEGEGGVVDRWTPRRRRRGSADRERRSRQDVFRRRRARACHSPSGDLAGIAKRLEGLALLQRMLYPSLKDGAGSRAKVNVTRRVGRNGRRARWPTATSSRSG